MSRVEIDGKRRYATPDGEKLPSVTTILDATKSEESKQALQNWRNRVGHQKAKEIGEVLESVAYVTKVETIETNIIIFYVDEKENKKKKFTKLNLPSFTWINP